MSDQIIPEDDFHAKRLRSHAKLSGRAWVKREFEFWHRCTVEHDGGTAITVSLDNMDELTVERDRVQSFELEKGDLVFVQHWDGSISGNPAFVVAVQREGAEVEYPGYWYGKTERYMHLLRDLRFYSDPALTDWKKGTRVFAYKAIPFRPPLFLFFPAIVKQVHNDVCVEVEFGDGGTTFVPSTLVEPCEVSAGDTVHTCTSYLTHGTNPDERWGACRVLQREADNLLLQDDAGQRFESRISMIAVLPNGYQMPDGKLEKIANAAAATSRADVEPLGSCDVRVSRPYVEPHDEDAITKAKIDALIAADPELSWANDDWNKLTEDQRIVKRSFSILWKGQPCFLWYRFGVRCTAPNAEQLAKMIEIAEKLDADVIGDDGTEYF